MSVLLVACPCVIGLATPIIVWSALSRLAERGLIVSCGDTIERLAEVDCVMLDKTGTLTGDSFALLDIVTARSGDDRARLLGWLAAIQERSRHPIARPFAKLPRITGDAPRIVTLRTVPGRGVEAEVESERVRAYRSHRHAGLDRIIRARSVARSIVQATQGHWASSFHFTRRRTRRGGRARGTPSRLGAGDTRIVRADGIAGRSVDGRHGRTHNRARSSSRARQDASGRQARRRRASRQYRAIIRSSSAMASTMLQPSPRPMWAFPCRAARISR